MLHLVYMSEIPFQVPEIIHFPINVMLTEVSKAKVSVRFLCTLEKQSAKNT